MNRAEHLPPIALKASESHSTLPLILRGYVRATEKLLCPLCQTIFTILLDPQDRSEHPAPNDASSRAIAYFREKITQDHREGHQRARFMMR